MADVHASEFPGDLSSLARGGRLEPVTKPRRRGIDPDLAAGLGIDEGQLADVGQVAFARIGDLDAEDLVSRCDGGQRPDPVSWSAEVGDHDDKPATTCR